MSNGTAPPLPPHQQHAPPYPPPQYHHQQYPPPAPMPSNVAPNGQNGVMRYPLPPQPQLDARQMSGGRHKKEIKRRTKTGCLTCRKRRIKVSAMRAPERVVVLCEVRGRVLQRAAPISEGLKNKRHLVQTHDRQPPSETYYILTVG